MTVAVVLCFGGRDYSDYPAVAAALERFRQELENTTGAPDFAVLHGDARGADRMSGGWAKTKGFCQIIMPAPWDNYGKASGPMRNQWLLDYGRPTHAIGFPGAAGTRDMAKRVRDAGIWLWSPTGAEL